MKYGLISMTVVSIFFGTIDSVSAETTTKSSRSSLAGQSTSELFSKLVSDYKKRDLRIVPTLGFTSMRLRTGTGHRNWEPEAGRTVGVLVHDRIEKSLVAIYGLQYSEANSSFESSDSFSSSQVNLKRQYFSFPIFLQKDLSSGARTGFHTKAGMVPAYLQRAKYSVSAYDFDTSETFGNDGSVGSDFKRYDLTAAAGVGYHMADPNSKTSLSLDLVANYGLVDTVRGSGPGKKGLNDGLSLTGAVIF